MPVSVSPETYNAAEVEEAFLAATRENAFRGRGDLCAKLTQMVCFWYRIDSDGRQEVITHLERKGYLSTKSVH